MSRVKKALVGYAAGLSIAAVGCDFEGEQNPYNEAFLQEENIPVLEEIILEQGKLFDSLAKSESVYDEPDAESAAIGIFEKDIKPEMEKLIDMEFESPDVSIGYFGLDNFHKMVTGFSFFGFLIGCSLGISMGIYETRSFIRNKQKKFKSCISYGIDMTACSALLAFGGFLGMASVITPINNSNCYMQNNETVHLTQNFLLETTESLSLTMAHESSHYLQDQCDVEWDGFLLEGHANGIERKLSEYMYEKTGNTGFRDIIQKKQLLQLVLSYKALCEEFSIEPDPEIMKYSDLIGSKFKNDYEHSVGDSLFQIREHQWGDRIYRDVLEGDYCRILNSPDENSCELPAKYELSP